MNDLPSPAEVAPSAAVDPRVSRTLRVVAYNFLSGGSAARTGHWSRLTRDLGADIVLGQECRPPKECPGERFRPGASDGLLWSRAGSSRWGSAVLARAGRIEPLAVPGYEGWIVGGTLSGSSWSGPGPLRIFSVHCPVGEKGYVRTLHDILDRLAPLLEGCDAILGGDFNVVVGYRQPNERRTISRGERAILDRLAGEMDLVSCWQEAHPRRPLAQTLRWSANRAEPYHCDGIFASRRLRERLAGCRVVQGSRWARLSDHNPVIAEFRDPVRPSAA